LKRWVRRPELFRDPNAESGPPGWIRSILFITCTGVSFAHGSNDGQKGMGLILVILIGILPAQYAVNLELTRSDVAEISRAATEARAVPAVAAHAAGLGRAAERVEALLRDRSSLRDLSAAERSELRRHSIVVTQAAKELAPGSAESRAASALKRTLDRATLYVPLWVKIAVALALSLGTMIGWQRIVVTVGEKIGKSHLSYAQGAAAEVSAMSTIFAGDMLGLPLSTTHVLSSGIAGTMVANRSGLQKRTVQQVLLAWVLTLPVCVFLGALLFALVLNILLALGL
jgi:PiT family inorganic phosphate transporter